MRRYFLLLAFAIPMSGPCQSYARSPFYSPVSAIPSMARVEGYEHGSIKANGVVIDLSEWTPDSSPDAGAVAGWDVGADTDGSQPTELFHFYLRYNRLNVVFAYDLLVETVEGTDKIKCTFSAFTTPKHWPWPRTIVPVALPADLTPVVVRSGDVISIPTLPLGEGRIAAVHYLRLTRTDLTSDSAR
jgi:hypothetical protein